VSVVMSENFEWYPLAISWHFCSFSSGVMFKNFTNHQEGRREECRQAGSIVHFLVQELAARPSLSRRRKEIDG
jgi:hypothetical protein